MLRGATTCCCLRLLSRSLPLCSKRRSTGIFPSPSSSFLIIQGLYNVCFSPYHPVCPCFSFLFLSEMAQSKGIRSPACDQRAFMEFQKYSPSSGTGSTSHEEPFPTSGVSSDNPEGSSDDVKCRQALSHDGEERRRQEENLILLGSLPPSDEACGIYYLVVPATRCSSYAK